MKNRLMTYFLKTISILIMAVLWFSNAHADVVAGAETGSTERITDIVLAPWGTESFAISTTNSQNTCTATNGWIIFAASNMASQQSYDRAYALALSAMSANQPIFVDSASGTDCSAAYMIGVGSVY